MLKDDILAYQQGKLQALDIIRRIRAAQAPDRDQVRLSEAQRGLLARQQRDLNDPIYNVPWCFRVLEPLDRFAFERAAHAVYERYPLLASRIVERDGEFVHAISRGGGGSVEWEDRPGADDRAVSDCLRGWFDRPFALGREAPFRIHLLSRGPSDHRLLFVAHHIVVDGHSLPLILATLWDAYDAGADAPAPLPDDGFARFVDWQREWLNGRAAQDDRRYWRTVLADPWPAIEFGNAAGATASTARDAGVRSLALPATLVPALRTCAVAAGVAASVPFLAAYRVMLSRATGERDLVIGTATMTRPDDRYEASVGFFVNMVLLRSRMIEGQCIGDLLRTEQRVLADAIDHGLYPFTRVTRDLAPARQHGGSPLYEAAFGYVARGLMDWGSAAVAGVRRHRIEVVEELFQQADCDLLLEVRETAAGFDVVAKYDRSRLAAGTVEGLLANYLAILADMVADPTAPVGSVGATPIGPTVSASPAKHEGVHRSVEAAVRLYPGATAVEADGERITYGELNARANRLARHLVGQGLEPDRPVAVCGSAGIPFVVAALAVLKAGGGYLPLDSGYPVQRLTEMMRTAAPAAVILVDHMQFDADAMAGGVPVIRFDADARSWAGYAADDLDGALDGSGLAYAIYTSGSTGRPKAVEVSHRNLAHTLEALRPIYDLDRTDRVLQFAAVSFDVAVLEMFLALTSGAALVIRTDRWIESPVSLRERCAATGITIVHLTASLWHRFLVADGVAAPASLRMVVIGGEPASGDWVEAWHRQNPNGPALFNQYGPAETTIVATMATLTDLRGPVAIGRPIEGVRTYIVDDDDALAPEGSIGELLIGGGGVSRGYRGEPELTAARFVPDRFGDEPGARLYRTGDLVRRTAGGELVFCGRIDRQMKLRGFRIEPEEIEACLAGHPAISEAAVIRHGGGDASARLVAYLVAHDGASISSDGIRAFARTRLPEHMVPATFVTIGTMPLGANGKRDMDALLAMPEPSEAAPYSPPRNELEEALVGIFADVLKRPRIGIEDDLFEQGGDSLSAAQIVARIRQLLDLEVPLTLLFEVQNVAGLADEIVMMLDDAEPVSAASRGNDIDSV